MSQENVELVERMLERFHAGDAEGSLTYFSADVITDITIRADTPTGHGRQELARIVGSWLSAWEGWREEIDEIRDLGEVDTQYVMLFQVRDGELSRMSLHPDPAAALEAAGLAE